MAAVTYWASSPPCRARPSGSPAHARGLRPAGRPCARANTAPRRARTAASPRPRVAQHAAEVRQPAGGRRRASPPGDEVAHRRVGVERLVPTAERGARVRPAQLGARSRVSHTWAACVGTVATPSTISRHRRTRSAGRRRRTGPCPATSRGRRRRSPRRRAGSAAASPAVRPGARRRARVALELLGQRRRPGSTAGPARCTSGS